MRVHVCCMPVCRSAVHGGQRHPTAFRAAGGALDGACQNTRAQLDFSRGMLPIELSPIRHTSPEHLCTRCAWSAVGVFSQTTLEPPLASRRGLWIYPHNHTVFQTSL